MPTAQPPAELFVWLRITAWVAATFFAIAYGSRGFAALSRGWGARQLALRQSSLFVLATLAHTAHAALLIRLAVITHGQFFSARGQLHLAVVLLGGTAGYVALYLVTFEALGIVHPARKVYRAASFYIWAVFTVATLLGATRYHFIAPIAALLILAGYCRLVAGRKPAKSATTA